IVLWRAWVLWNRNRVFSAISLILLLGSVGEPSYHTVTREHVCSCQPLFEADAYGLAAFVLSLVTNLWATSQIGWKAWCATPTSHKKHLRQGGARTRSEKIMALFIESGLVYCLIWVSTHSHSLFRFLSSC
ncbi:hypothetical protein OF83DRAFT_1065611, partial [Amylostereum chailletii]